MAISKEDATQIKRALVDQFTREPFDRNSDAPLDALIASIERVDSNIKKYSDTPQLRRL